MIPAILVQTGGAAFNALVSFVLIVFLARALGPGAFGIYAATLGTALVALAFIEGGWASLLYRETADATGHQPALARRGSNASAHVLGATAVLLALTAASALVDADGALRALPAALLCMGTVAAANLVSARLRGEGRFSLEAAWQAGGRVTSALAIVAAVAWVSRSVEVIFLAWFAALALLLALPGRRWLARPSLNGLSAAYAAALPLAAIDTLAATIMKGEVAVLGFAGAEPAALSQYAACARLSECALLLFAAGGNVLLRTMRRADACAYRGWVRRAVASGLAAGVLAVALAALAGPWIMRLLFGPGYEPAGHLLKWVALALPFSLCNLLLIPSLVARNRDGVLVACLAGGALLLCCGLIAGHHVDGLRGSALGAAAAQALLFAACLPAALRATPPESACA